MNDKRRSLWRKWDLHVHTPKSIISSYGGDKPEIWDKFIKSQHGADSCNMSRTIAFLKNL